MDFYLKAYMLGHAIIRVIGVLSLVFFIGGCAGAPPIQPQVDAFSSGAQYESALNLLDDGKNYGKNNELLFLLDKALIEHYSGNYEASIDTFARAGHKFDELYTKSVSKIAETWVINDYAAPYHGEDFEYVMINVFQALNYFLLGKYEDALVEARDVDSKLGAINLQYKDGQKNVYKEDAFARMLMGIMYEAEGTREDINDAYISYSKAENIYSTEYEQNYGVRVPLVLKENLLSAAKKMGFIEYGGYALKYPHVPLISFSEKEKKAQVYLIQYNGVSPVKVEETVTVPTLDGYMVKIAFPKYKERNYAISFSKFMAFDGKGKTAAEQTELVQDIGAIAEKNLDNRKLRFIAKATLRATGKYILEKKEEENIRKKRGNLAAGWFNFLANMYNLVTEKADLRAWQTLPDQIRMARLVLDPGEYNFTLENFNADGTYLDQINLPKRTLRPGEIAVLTVHTAR